MRGDVDRAIQRTRQYWYEDGLTEIAVGCLFLAVGLLFFVEASLPPSPGAAVLSALGLPVVVLGGFLIARRVVAWAKARLTYPRTRYVGSRGQRSPRARLDCRRGSSGGPVGGAALAGAGLLAWMPALQGVLVGAFWLYLAYSLSIVRFLGRRAALGPRRRRGRRAGLGARPAPRPTSARWACRRRLRRG